MARPPSVTGVGRTTAAFRGHATVDPLRIEAAVSEQAAATEARIKLAAPRRTGRYARSIHADMHAEPGAPSAVVGTREPYGQRLEYGYTGTDRLGRHYATAPRPHFRPAADVLRETFPAAIRAAIGRPR